MWEKMGKNHSMWEEEHEQRQSGETSYDIVEGWTISGVDCLEEMC